MEKKIKCLFCVLSAILLVMSMLPFFTITAKASGTVDDFVERCYTVTLDRGSDPDGFADWKGQLLNGKAVGVHVAYGFLFSEEYTTKNKSNEDYVKDLYMLFMGREPDEAGFNDWVGQLNDGKSRVEVYAGFANSQEFYNICSDYGITAGRFVVGYDRYQVNNVNLFVERLYKTCLGRRGDKDGQRNWVEKLLKREITGVECARSFIQSSEYVNKGLTDDEYVENLYIAMMGRNSDAGGKANWVNGLSSGSKTRDEVFEGFANSSEFGTICANYKIEKGSYKAQNISIKNRTQTAITGNLNNPQSAWIKTSAVYQEYSFYNPIPYEIRLEEYYNGSQANYLVSYENRFNTTPNSSQQWLLMKFYLKNNGSETLEASDIVSPSAYYPNFYTRTGASLAIADNAVFSKDRSGMSQYNLSLEPGAGGYFWIGILVPSDVDYPYIKISNGYDGGSRKALYAWLDTKPIN